MDDGRSAGGAGEPVYQFRLDDHIPSDHMLRAIDRFVDLDGFRRHLAPFYSTTGRPSIDPELMIRMLLVGYCFGIRSERPRGTVDRRSQRTCVLRLCRQLPDRSEDGCYSRRRGDTRDPPGRSRRRKNHDRTHRRSLRAQTREGLLPTAANSLDWLVKTKGIAPHIPVLDKSRRDDGTFLPIRFPVRRSEEHLRLSRRPTRVTTRGTVVGDDQVLYRASKFDCTP